MSDPNLERILILDDNADYRRLIKTFLKKVLPNVDVIEHDAVLEGVPDDDFDWHGIDVLLLDYQLSMVGPTGLDILHKYYKKPEFPATIMLTSQGNEEIAVQALKFGIYEYHTKQALTKDKLKKTIIAALETRKSYRKKQQEITQHTQSFSKEIFYKNLELAYVQKQQRLLVVMKPNNIKTLELQIGIIGKDNLVNYIGRNSFSVFQQSACNPNITRTSDDAVAVQIDHPGSLEKIESNMQALCAHFTKNQFKFAEKRYDYTVRIGVLDLSLFKGDAEKLINLATVACDSLDDETINAYYIWQGDDSQSPTATTTVETNARHQSKSVVTKTEPAEQSVAKSTSKTVQKKAGQIQRASTQDEARAGLIQKLIDAKKIVQTYRPVINMTVADGDGVRDIYKTGLKSIIENDQINQLLTDPSVLSIPLQKTINEWALRQIFLHITEAEPGNCHYIFLFPITKVWFTDITLFEWLQKILLSQTQQYNPGRSIILNMPFALFMENKERAAPLVNILQKKHFFKIALSDLPEFDSYTAVAEILATIPAKFLIIDIDRLKRLSELPEHQDEHEENDRQEESQSILQELQQNGLRIITSGVETSALLMDVITAGTDYAIGDFIGEIQDNLLDSDMIESLELG